MQSQEFLVLRSAFRRLSNLVASLQSRWPTVPRDFSTQGVYVGKADATIPALSGSTPNSGTVSIWEPNASNVWADTGRNETAYNFSDAVAADTFVKLVRHSQSGKLLVDDGSGLDELVKWSSGNAATDLDQALEDAPGYDAGEAIQFFVHEAGVKKWKTGVPCS